MPFCCRHTGKPGSTGQRWDGLLWDRSRSKVQERQDDDLTAEDGKEKNSREFRH